MTWSSVKLAEVATIEREGINASDIASGTQYLGLEHIEAGGRILGAQEVESDQLASTKFQFDRNHILYGKLRPYLAKIALPNFSGVCSTDILPIRPGPRIDRTFLACFLRQPSMVEFAASRASGANLPRLSPTALADFDVPLPPIDAQKRIAAILDQADSLRRLRQCAIDRLNSLGQAIFYEMFGDPAINPRRWRSSELGSLITSGPQNGLYKPASMYGQGTPILRIDAFYDGRVTKLGELKRLAVNDNELTTYALQPDDIVINRVNSTEYLGKSAVIPALSEPTVFESNMMRFRIDERQIHPHYLIHYLQTPFFKAQIGRRTKDAVNQSSINQQDLKSFVVRIPPLDLQTRFVERIAVSERLARSLGVGLVEAGVLFSALQHIAFRGEL